MLRTRGYTLHPDAAAWATAVINNSGTFSTTTLRAVSDFAADIERAALRDRFARLNLVCGSDLKAAVVPLYRGASLTGTQYGNTVDTNSGSPSLFVSGDYAENAGLTGNGSTGGKYLNPGTPGALKGDWTTHHFGVDIASAYPDGTTRYQIGAQFNEGATSPRGWYAIWGTSTTRTAMSGMLTRTGMTTSSNLKMVIRTATNDMKLFEDNTQVGSTQSGTDTATQQAACGFCIMALGYQNVSGGVPTTVVNGYAAATGTLRGYTIGESMDATQRGAFVSAWVAFQTKLGRR